MTDLATLGFKVDTSGLAAGSAALDQFGAKAKAAGASVAQGTEQAKSNATATGIYAKAVNDAANAHGGFNTQAMAAFHAARSMAEGIAMGIPPAQMLAMQLNHLSYAASGPGGLVGAFQGALGMFTSMLTPMRMLVGGAAAVAGAFYLIYESIKTTEVKFADLQDKIGGTLQSLHGLQSAALLKGGGIGQDDFLSAMEKFGSLAIEAEHHVGSLAELFRANGVAVSRDLNVNLARTADLVANAANQQEKYRIIALAGLPATQKWVQFLSQGGASIMQAAQQANNFGSIAEQEMIAKARDFDTAWARVWQDWKNEGKAAIIEVVDFLMAHKNDFAILAGGAAAIALATGHPVIAAGLAAGTAAIAAMDEQSKTFDARFNSATQLISDYSEKSLSGALNRKAGISTSGKTTVNPQDAVHDQQMELQRISIMGQLATVEDQVRAKEIAIQQARLAGVGITKSAADRILEYTRNEALGINQIRASADAYKVEADTVGMSTGEAVKYAAIQNKINEQRRLGNTLTPQSIALITAEADALGKAAQKAEDTKFAFDTTRGLFQDTLSGLQQGKSAWESFGNAAQNALNKIESKLLDMILNNLWAAAFPGGGTGGITSIFASLFVGHAATGGSFGPGRIAVVGENGPELLQTHPGGGVTVYSNSQSRRMGIPGFADGGGFDRSGNVIRPPSSYWKGGGNAGGGVTNNFIVEAPPGSSVEKSQQPNAQGGIDFRALIRSEAKDATNEHLASGGADSIMRGRYGVPLRPRPR